MALVPPKRGPYLANIHVKEETQLVVFDEFLALSSDGTFVNRPCILSYLHIDKFSDGTFAKEVKKDTISKFTTTGGSFGFTRGGSFRFTQNHIVGYCNGVFLSSQAHGLGTTLVVIYPRKKECYELPSWSDDLGVSYIRGLGFDDATERSDGQLPKSLPCTSRVFYSCGIGLDDSTMTYKIVCIMRKRKVDEATNEFCTLVHVFGTSSWREIPNPPCYGTMTNEGVFVHGCLHWYTHCSQKIVCFDVKKETFKLIDSPKYLENYCAANQLVDLHGELGLVYHVDNVSMEMWLLKNNQWMLHCKLDRKQPIPKDCPNYKQPIPDDCQVIIKVLGCGNKDGEIFMTTDDPGEKSSSKMFSSHWLPCEVRQGGERVGFEVVTLDGRTAPLASVNTSNVESIRWPTVGRYKVDVASFESLALPELQIKEDTDLFVIDEVGKMELFSSLFFPAVLRVLESNKPLLATIPVPKGGRDIPAVARLKNHPGATVFTLTTSNRDAMKDQVYS
ncbi:cancer-related nucleoside-triphosphatase [Tanacetum coccineum]